MEHTWKAAKEQILRAAEQDLEHTNCYLERQQYGNVWNI